VTSGPYVGLTIRNGWVVPEIDNQCLPWVLNEIPKFDVVMKYVTNKGSCIQAGGNIGVFPHLLCKHFEWIYSFEPDEANFKALELNTHNDNVSCLPVALGEKKSSGIMRVIDPTNIGAHRIEFNEGGIKVNTIDEYLLGEVGLIWLDIEGAELLALKGGIDTIKTFKPVIVLEMAGHSKRFYNIDEEETHAWLKSLGYEAVESVQQDVIFVHKGE
jgi:FkbM family methyltransferase